ncbi:transaldolase [Methanomicrobium antiquum]|uniref:Transaldolase n=1 Tax=Methanomicrobium antiquum TaxID=487686 RepID=A0AAF0FNM8_9EURY|nr:transaldolase [Methanomicrobium antiquum]WFN36787.1 transaldolase [Methanomicrobium antiquum]
MSKLSDFKIKLYADGADIEGMIEEYKKGVASGFTTNPTLMKKAGVKSYEEFAKAVLKEIPDLPISFEVFSDDLSGMEREARKIAGWGDNVYIKIPVTNTKGESTAELVKKLSQDGLKLNVTAILTLEQVKTVADALSVDTPSIVSVFAGRIADTGRDPMPIMKDAVEILKSKPKAELLWASTREILNLIQAESCGCHIITITNDILKKVPQVGKDLSQLSLETVQMFYNDAQSAGYKI